MFRPRFHVVALVLLIAAQLLGTFPTPLSNAYAGLAAVNAGTVTDCSNDADLNAKLAEGGEISFDCGTATIPFSGTKTITENTIVDGGNQITLSGGDLYRHFLVNANVTLTLRNITIIEGFANGDGGAIHGVAQSWLVVENSTFRDNHTAVSFSGGAIVTYGTAMIRDSRFEENSGGGAGAFYARFASSVSTIENTVFVENHGLSASSGWGGAILLWDGAQLTLRDSHLEGNTALDAGGAIFNTNHSQLTVEGSTLVKNHSDHTGGAIYNSGSLQLIDTVIQENEAAIFGAGITNFGGDLQGERVRVLANKILELEDDAYGGGIYNLAIGSGETALRGVVRLTDSTLTANVARDGSGLYSSYDTDLILDSVTVSGHSAVSGGGLYSRGVTKITNSTFSGNNAGASGGAIFVDFGTVDVAYSTFAGNGEGANNSIYFSPGATTNHNFLGTIVAGACASPDTGSLGFNLESGQSCGFNTASDKQNGSAVLGPLADNGGATLTHFPAAGSGAINAGGDGCPFIDQRSFLRPTDGLCEIGAVEVAAPPLIVTPFPPDDGPPDGLTPQPDVTPSAPAAPPPIVHSNLPNGVAPTITVSPQAGAAGASINISGKSVPGYSQLRIVSMLDGRTMGMVPVTADAGGNYSLPFTIPASTRPGPIELCAVVVGTENANFACAPLQIQPLPPATVEGKLPIGVTVDKAEFHLMNAAGRTLYTATVGSDRSFSLSNVTPGVYGYRVVGNVSRTIVGGVAQVGPSKTYSPDLSHDLGCRIGSLAANTGGVHANPSRSSFVTKQTAIKSSSTSSSAIALAGGAPLFDVNSRPIGIYVSGVQTNVTFDAAPQANGTVESVIFQFFNRDATAVGDAITVNAPLLRTIFDVGRLAPSSGNRHPYVQITPVVNGEQQCPYRIDIEVIANPFQGGGVQPNALVWDAGKELYLIQGIVPHIPDILPADFRLPPNEFSELDFFGRFDNRLNAGIQVVGTLNLDGQAHLQAIRAVAHAYLMNQELIPPNWSVPLMYPNLRLNIVDLRETQFPIGPYSLLPDAAYINTPFLEVPVITFFGLVDVTVNASAGMGADVTISGYIKPLKPEVGATLTGTGKAHAELGAGIRLLAGLARAGATARVDAELNAPFSIYLDPSPDAEIDACLNFVFSVRAFASAAWGLVEKDETKKLAEWAGCVSEIGVASAQAAVEPSAPDVLAAPVIAIGTNGTHLSAYVQNNAAQGATPQVQVMARLRFADQNEWSEPVALSNAAFSADAPWAALVGPEQWPLVAWAEKKLTFDEATQLGGDINALLQRQEIVYRLYRNGAWEPAVYLTDDALSATFLGDGLPTIAGGTGGAVLAWTRDLDGNWLTRADQRIAATTFDPATATFAPFTLLSGGGTGLNGDVKAAWDATNNRPYLVWVFDADADLNSAGDRRLALAYLDDLEWVLLNPQPLPPRVDSPTITVGPEGIQLAFLVREPGANGDVSLVGTNGVLWTAHFADGAWAAAPLLDSRQRPIWGEEPVLAGHGPESLLLFRRFGQTDDNSKFGQLALSRIVGAAGPTQPLYMTDEPRQNWQGQLAINPVSGVAQIMRVSRMALDAATIANADALTAIASTEAIAATQETMLNHADDPVSTLDYTSTADPALDPLRVSTQVAPAGTTFTISATVRNVGRSDAAGVVVRLYAGVPGSGTLLQTSNLLPILPFNGAATSAFAVEATGGAQAFYAEVVPNGAESSADNNRAALVVGNLSQPVMVGVVESTSWVDGLDVNWIAPKDEVVLGFRILRGNGPTGPFDLVGESSVPGFTDVPLTRDETFCYAVQTYNANTVSTRSEAICAKLPPAAPTSTSIFMPRVGR